MSDMDLRSQMEQLGAYNLAIEGQLTEQLAGNLLAALNWCEEQPQCKQNLGISRSQMPQFGFGAVPEFVEWLKFKHGVKSKYGLIEVGKLRATQREINADKVEAIANRSESVGGDPIPVSRDHYILDGHHRWAASLSRNPRNRIKAIKIDLPIKPLLKLANKFPGVFQRGFNDDTVPQRAQLVASTYDWRHR